MNNETNDDQQEIPMDTTLPPSGTLPELKPWTAPMFERMNLKDAMAGGFIITADATCS